MWIFKESINQHYSFCSLAVNLSVKCRRGAAGSFFCSLVSVWTTIILLTLAVGPGWLCWVRKSLKYLTCWTVKFMYLCLWCCFPLLCWTLYLTKHVVKLDKDCCFPSCTGKIMCAGPEKNFKKVYLGGKTEKTLLTNTKLSHTYYSGRLGFKKR